MTYSQGLQEVMACDERCQMMTDMYGQGWQEVRAFGKGRQATTNRLG